MNDELPIHYLGSQTEIFPGYLPGAEAGQIWLALHKTLNDSVDPASPRLGDNEQSLYDALTKKFIFDASLLGLKSTTTEP